MEKILDVITQKVSKAFQEAGYEAAYGKVTVSNRPDLCQFQCNGALAAAKQYKCAPIQIANAVAEKLQSPDFSMIQAVTPGFLNLNVSDDFLASYLERMRTAPGLGIPKTGEGQTVVVDYGGPNVAKPLHIGHLRSAIIGESLKRIYRFFGYNAIGDIHLGDWGLQMGLIIAELQERQPELPYFDPDFPTLTRTLPGNTRRKPPSPSPNWRRFTPPPPPKRRKTRNLRKRPTTPPSSCNRAAGATGRCGSTS